MVLKVQAPIGTLGVGEARRAELCSTFTLVDSCIGSSCDPQSRLGAS
jgi:hypothetical protein